MAASTCQTCEGLYMVSFSGWKTKYRAEMLLIARQKMWRTSAVLSSTPDRQFRYLREVLVHNYGFPISFARETCCFDYGQAMWYVAALFILQGLVTNVMFCYAQ